MQTCLLLSKSHRLDLVSFSERSLVSKLAQSEMLGTCKAKAVMCQERSRKNPVQRKHSPGPALRRSVQNAEGRRDTKVVDAQSSGSRPVGTRRCTLKTWKPSLILWGSYDSYDSYYWYVSCIQVHAFLKNRKGKSSGADIFSSSLPITTWLVERFRVDAETHQNPSLYLKH